VLRFRSLGSGSAGNGTVVEAGSGAAARRLLIDCGFGPRQLAQRLARAGLACNDLDGIFITHEHSDHVGCAVALAQQHAIAIWMSPGTYAAIGSPPLGSVMQDFLALDSDGNPMLVGNSTFFEAFRLRAGSWEAVTPVPAPSGIYGQFPRLTTGPDHMPVIAWIDTSNNNQRTVAYARWVGTRWDSRAGFFSQGSNTLDETPQVVVDRQGSVWVGWRNVSNVFNVWMSNY